MRLRAWTIGVPAAMKELVAAIAKEMKPVVDQVNNLSEGQAKAVNNATTAPPGPASTKQYAASDFIKNSDPEELGTAGAKYVVLGWICVQGGTPGTFRECRCLTGA